MSSKSAKLKSHRIRQRQFAGRKPKEGVERYPSGQIRHSAREQEVRSVAVEALDRVHSLSYDKRGYSGYVLGRMHLDGRIPVFQRGVEIGSVPADFEPCAVKPTTVLYEVRPGDFKRIAKGWEACRTLGPGDLDAVPEFQRKEQK